jgi:hypothetical protein
MALISYPLTKKGSSVVPIGVPGITLLEPKRVLAGTKIALPGTSKGSPMGTAEEPF